MTKTLGDSLEGSKVILVGKAASRLILNRQYILTNFECIQQQEGSLLENTATCFAD